MTNGELSRIRKIAERAISDLHLDLSGFTVLTEVGSNYFLFTPIIAAMANASKVYAWTRDSSFGRAEQIVEECKHIMSIYGIAPAVVEFAINKRPAQHIQEADIVTNLGFVRPIDTDFLIHLRSDHSVIPAMCEAWELRGNDIDLEFCRKHSIKVAGTWENHPKLKIFDACGPLAVKMAQEAGYEVYQNKIVVWSNDHFGDVVENAFLKFGASAVTKTTDPLALNEMASDLDFIFLCDYDENRSIIGQEGFISSENLLKKNPALGIVHLYGTVDNEYANKIGLAVYPDKKGSAEVMTHTLAHLGPIPIINLHAAGLKVGECLKKNINDELVQVI